MIEIVVTQSSYRWRAVLVEPTQPKSWLCQEFANVGLETEGKINSYVEDTTHVRENLQRLIDESL